MAAVPHRQTGVTACALASFPPARPTLLHPRFFHRHHGDRRAGCLVPAKTLLCSHSAATRPVFPVQRRSAPHTPIAPTCDDGSDHDHDCPSLPDGDDEDQARARFRPDGAAAAIPATRTKVVMPTATAPMAQNVICHASDGIRCFTMPWVARKPAITADATKIAATIGRAFHHHSAAECIAKTESRQERKNPVVRSRQSPYSISAMKASKRLSLSAASKAAFRTKRAATMRSVSR